MDQDEGSEPDGGDTAADDNACGGAASGRAAAGTGPVSAALAGVRASIAVLRQAAGWAQSDAQCRDAVAECHVLVQQLECCRLTCVAELDSRPTSAVPGARPHGTAAEFLRAVVHRTPAQAHADVRVAHAIAADADPAHRGLPELGRAFAAGLVSREHVDVAVRTMRRIPLTTLAGLVPAPRTGDDGPTEDTAGNGDAAAAGEATVSAGAAVDAFFADHARDHDPHQTQNLARHLLAALDPDAADGFTPQAHTRRGETHAVDAGGMVAGRFQLDPVNGEWYVTALQHFSAPDPARTETAEDGSSTTVKDERTAAQRRADALGLIARLALGCDQAGTAKGGEPPRIVLHTGVEDLHAATHHTDSHTPDNDPPDSDVRPDAAGKPFAADGFHTPVGLDLQEHSGSGQVPGARGAGSEKLGPVGPRLLGRHACDCVLQKALLAPTGALLDLGRDTRTISTAQRRALNARDRGCVRPGCTAPPQFCEGHHVRWWRHGGRTDIADLALLCGRCHDLIHLGVWDLTMIDGVPWARPPSWIDSQRRLIRNTLHDDADRAHTLGTQLRLTLDPPDPSGSGYGGAANGSAANDSDPSHPGDPPTSDTG